MTREEYLIRMKRDRQRGSDSTEKKSYLSLLITRSLICVIVCTVVMSLRGVEVINKEVKHYLGYTVDCKDTIENIINEFKAVW